MGRGDFADNERGLTPAEELEALKRYRDATLIQLEDIQRRIARLLMKQSKTT